MDPQSRIESMARDFTTIYGKTALITGASSGLGAEFARQLAEKGMNLVLVARRVDKLEEVKKEVQSKHSVEVELIAQDLAERDCAEAIKRNLDQKQIEIDLLVNNAGFGSHGLFQELDADWETKMVDVNVRAPVALTSVFLPEMLKRNRGGIIFLGSVASYQPTPFFANYGATKAWNLMFGEALWAETRKSGVDVMTLSPGYTRTSFQEVGDVHANPPGGYASSEVVVARALKKLGKKPSTIYGFRNWFLAWTIRFTPRRLAALIAYFISKPRGK